MKNYEFKLVAKGYTKEGNLNRPRRSKSHCEKIAMKSRWDLAAMAAYLAQHGSLHLSATPIS